MPEKCFVIGSNSFSGATFVDLLLRKGIEVVGASRSPEPIGAFLPYKWTNKEKRGSSFVFAQLDLNKDSERIAQSMEGFRPDYVVNFAAQSMVAERWLYPEHWYQTNVTANVRLHEKLRHFTFIKKYVHVSPPD